MLRTESSGFCLAAHDSRLIASGRRLLGDRVPPGEVGLAFLMAHTFQVWVPLVVATSHELGLAFLVMLEHLFLDFGSFKDGFDLE